MPATNSSPGTNTVLKEEIRQALKAFKGGNLHERAREFFNILGYLSERTLELGGEPQSFIDRFASPGKRGTQTEQFLLKAATAIHIIFQITDEEIKSGAKQDSFLDELGFYEGQAKTFLYVAVELEPGDYARGKYAGMTREISKRFGMPVCVLFRNGERITLAFAHRRASRKPGDADREVLEKVSLIREINEANPHRAHLDILAELSLGDRLLWMEQNQKSINFDGLLAAWLAKLDTEELNKRFYKELFDWFQWAVKAVNFPCPEQKPVLPEDHVIRLITRILFVWFIKEKQLVAEDLFIENKIRPLLKKYTRDNDDYYRAVLQNLFFATLNTEIKKRDFSDKDRETHRNFNRYRYEDLLENPDELKRLMEQTPFINGGLFDCLDSEAGTKKDGYRLDCFSDNKNHRKQLSVPNRLFFDDSRGLFPLLNKYKFTVEENTPIEQEVALDPELLGKVFENLLSAYNPETRETARKQTGSYYTPRAIVGYMVDQALVASLAEKVKPTDGDAKFWQERLCYLLDYADAFDDAQDLFDKEEVKGIVKAISEMKVLDPAVGSGAFPMGILHKLTLALRRIDPGNKSWEELQKERARQKANDAFDTKDDDARREQLSEISETFAHYRDSDFGRKLYLIQNSIFGVDIQPVACQIAKLRFFISLTIEQTPTRDKSKNFGIKPLPNLETRFIAADTLIGLRLTGKDSLQSPAIRELEEKLKQNRERHFNAKTRQKKLDCSKKDQELRQELAETLEEHYQRDAVGNEAKRVVDEETKKLTRQLTDYRNKVEAGKQETLLENTGAQQNLWDAKIAELEVAIEKKRELVNAILLQDESVKSSVVWSKAEDAVENRNAQIHAESEKISQWNPYDQNAKADWFDREYMFGVDDGFDIVIGNPPYVQVKKGIYSEEQFPYAEGKDPGKQNLYKLFTEQSYNLCKINGVATMIVQSSLMCDFSSSGTRKLLLDKTHLLNIVEFPKAAKSKEKQVFESVTQGTCIYHFTKCSLDDYNIKISINNDNHSIKNLQFSAISKSDLQTLYSDYLYFPRVVLNGVFILQRINNNTSIKPLSVFVQSIRQGDINLTTHSSKFSKINVTNIKLMRGRNVARYKIKYNLANEYINEGFMTDQIKFNQENCFLISQEVTGTNDVRRLHFALQDNKIEKVLWGHSVNKTLLINQDESKYFLALLNSKFMDWYFRITSSNNHVQGYELEKLPIIVSKVNQQKFIDIVDKILDAKAENPTADTGKLEAKIDKLVYQLYDLTPDEINIIEGNKS